MHLLIYIHIKGKVLIYNISHLLLIIEEEYSESTFPTTEGFELSREARAQADLKFTYVLSCQIYGQQKQRQAPEAVDISLLLQRLIFGISSAKIELWATLFFLFLFLCIRRFSSMFS